jgi:putative exosortase-associated protein (TIGR04073 family)
MRNTLSLLAAAGLAGVLVSGCTNMQTKFGRGFDNTYEIVRLGEMRRTMEQTSLFYGSNYGATSGMAEGLGRSLARTGIGVYEMVTAPLPPYGPVFTDHFSPSPPYPDNYKPGIAADSMYDTDAYIGFSGGDVLPIVPGSRFRVFDTH